MQTAPYRAAIAAALVLVVASPAVGSVIVVDNLAEPQDVGLSIIGAHDFYPSDVYSANAFTVGAGSWDILSLTAYLAGNPSMVPFPAGHRPLEFQIRNDNGGAPGSTVLGTFLDNYSDATSTPSNIKFYAQSPLTLSGGNYWLVGAPTGAAEYSWAGTTSTVDNGVSGWSIADSAYQSFDGTNFDYAGAASLSFRITADEVAAVPEPSSLALCGLIAAAGGYVRRRRKLSRGSV